MKQIPDRLLELGWNQRILTLDDFHNTCEEEGILVHSSRLDWPGLYLHYRNRPVILLDESLRGHLRTLVAWHEYGHYLWHVPGCYGLARRSEKEADLIAHVALIPAFLLHLPDGEIAEMFGYGPALLRTRVEIFRRYGL